MNEQNKKRAVGAGALVVLALVAVWIIKTLATPADAPEGESVRVYEIMPNGQARAVGSESEKQAEKPAAEPATDRTVEPGVQAAMAKPAASKPAPAKPEKKAEPAKTETAKKPEATPPEVLAPKTSTKTAAAPASPAPKPAAKPAPKPEATAEAPKPVASTAAAKPAAPVDSGDWLVQVGSFGEQENADRVIAKLQPQFTVRSSPAVVNGKTYYRVQTGPYGSESEAKAAEKKLKSKGYGARAMQSP